MRHMSDCIWIGEPGVPTVEGWLAEKLTANDKVGADPNLITYGKNI